MANCFSHCRTVSTFIKLDKRYLGLLFGSCHCYILFHLEMPPPPRHEKTRERARERERERESACCVRRVVSLHRISSVSESPYLAKCPRSASYSLVQFKGVLDHCFQRGRFLRTQRAHNTVNMAVRSRRQQRRTMDNGEKARNSEPLSHPKRRPPHFHRQIRLLEGN